MNTDGHATADQDDADYRDYCAEALEALRGCTTPHEARKALLDAGLHVGRRPPDSLGKDWRVGLLEAVNTVENEESHYVVACTHALSMALLADAKLNAPPAPEAAAAPAPPRRRN